MSEFTGQSNVYIKWNCGAQWQTQLGTLHGICQTRFGDLLEIKDCFGFRFIWIFCFLTWKGSSFKTNECEKFLGSNRFCHFNKLLENWKDFQSGPNTNEKSKSETNEADGTSESSDRWFYISDAHVTEVNVSRVLKAQAYILFYQRIQ